MKIIDGVAVDYGIVSNNDQEISDLLQYIKSHNLADMEIIDERGIAAPHWHVSVYGVTEEGTEFLETPNQEYSL